MRLLTLTARMKLATWTAVVIALGWILTVAWLPFSGGHPPTFWVMGMGVILSSFVLAPIGAIAALLALRRQRRAGNGSTGRITTLLSSNVAFLAVAVGLWLWILTLTP